MSKIPLEHFLLFSPYDRDFAYRQTLKIDDFRKIRIIPKEFQEEKEHLEKVISPNSIERFFILSGYSGNGKTTFIHWFKEQIEKEDYYFEIVNLIEDGYATRENEESTKNEHSIGRKEPLMHACIKKKLSESLTNKKVICTISNNRAYFSTIFKRTQLAEICRIQCNQNFDIEEANYFLDSLNFRQILILFILDRVYHFTNDVVLKNKQSYTFCFDNLDELELEYLTHDMWETVLEVSQQMPEIITTAGINFEFQLKVKFILVFREANIAVASTQLNDKLVPLTDNRRFILTPFIGKDIIKERIKEYNLEDCSKNDRRIIEVLNVIINEDIIDYIILPLFNYDYRKLITATLYIVNNDFIDLSDYQKIPNELNKIIEIKYGKRGILINAYIKYLAKYNYLKKLADIRELDKKLSYCNKIRQMLTVFSNLSFDKNGISKNERELHEAKPNEFSLYKAYEACKDIVSVSEFFDKLTELVDMNKTSWAHLITIYGIEPIRIGRKEYRFDFNEIKEILSSLYEKNEKINFDKKNRIDNISFSLNASAYIYLRHILPHFEYMSAYKTREDGVEWQNMKPLFQLTEFNIDKMEWEFQIKLNDVFKHISTYCANTENYLQEKFVVKEDFVKSKYVFKGEITKGTPKDAFPLYMTRLITRHIRYIEVFRHYITRFAFEKIEENINALSNEIRELITYKTKEEIHSYLLGIIEKYLYEMEKINDPTQINILKEYKEILEQAKNNNDIWIQRKK